MDTDHYSIKKLTAENLDQYNELLRYAFQVSEKTLLETGWEEDEIKQSKFPVLERANVWGYFDENTLVSQFAAYPLEMNIHSVIYPIAFITSVSTYPEYAGRGLMSSLMKKSLIEMRENGQSLALLYPYSIPLYRHRGWEIISDKMSYAIKDAQLPKSVDVSGFVRRVPWESKDFVNLHQKFAKQTHGCLFRNELAWDEYWRWDQDDTNVAVYYNDDENPTGYMVYLIRDDVMFIKEMIFLDMDAKKGLWKYISAHESMVDTVKGNNFTGTPIAFTLEDSDIKETIRPNIMGRIVDLDVFIEKYPFRNDAEISFEIKDPFLEWNNKTFTLEINKGQVKMSNKSTEHKASMSIGTLTTLLLGYKQATELYELERINGDPQSIKILDQIITYKKPYISDYI